MLHRRHCCCGDSRRPTDGSPGHGLAPLPSSRPCHTLPACCHEGFDVELNLRSRSWRTWRRCPSPRPWLALMLAVGGKFGSGLLPPPPEPLHLPSTPFNSPWSATIRSRASRRWLWLEGRLAPVLRLSHGARHGFEMRNLLRESAFVVIHGTKDARLRWVASTPRRLAWTSPRF
jgi:hypothetical protein